MTAKAALAKAFLDGMVLNVKNCFTIIGLTNCSRECSRMIEKSFNVTLKRIPREGKSRYGQPIVWMDYKLLKTEENKPGIELMKTYVNKQIKSTIIKTEKELKQMNLNI